MEIYLGDNIRYLKMRKDVSNKEIEESTGISFIGNYTSGRNTPPLKTVIKLAKYFDVTLDDLVLSDLKNRDISMVAEPTRVYNKRTVAERMKLIELELEEIRKEMKK